MEKVVDEVGGVFDADGDADGAGLDAGAEKFVARRGPIIIGSYTSKARTMRGALRSSG